ncbi:MAG: DUF927 domain-containing protein [Hyphomicrobiales bacterium]
MSRNTNFNFVENILPACTANLPVDEVIAGAEEYWGSAQYYESDVAVTAVDEVQPFPVHPEFGTPDRVFTYRGFGGKPIMKICRWDIEKDGKPSKEIRPYSLIGDSWVWKAISDNRPLYNLDKLPRRGSQPVYITEGEKAADALEKLAPNTAVTAMSGGAKGFEKTDFSPLKNRNVVIFPDNDEAGDEFASKLGDLLLKTGVNSVKILDTKTWGTAAPQGDGEVIFGEYDECPDKWDAANAVEGGWTAKHFEAISKKIQNNDPSLAPYYFPKNWSFVTRGNEIFEVTKRQMKDGISTFEEYAFNPVFSKIEVLGSFNDNSGKSCGRVVKVCRHTMPVYKRDLIGIPINEVLQTLVDHGMKTPMQVARVNNYLKNFLMYHPNNKPLLLGTNTGWQTEGVFATPTWVTGKKDRELIFDCDSGQTREFEEKGSLLDWKQNVGGIAQPHNNLVFAISIAFTGPLLKPLGRNGFGVHFYGPSSTGKSTLSYAATSVWGPPNQRNKTWNTTNTALEVTATMNNDCLLSLDEINQGDPSAIYRAGYDLANGKGRGRGTAQGGMREIREWKLTFISNGEVPFSQYAKSSSGNDAMAGQETRILDIPVDAGASFGAFNMLPDNLTAPELADKIKQVTGNYHGVAGEAFVIALIDGAADAMSSITQYEVAFKAAIDDVIEGADGQVDRVAGQFALIAAAGEFAIEASVVDWVAGTAHEAAVDLFKRWTASRGGIGSSEDAKAIENANSFLSSYGSSRFAEIQGTDILELDAAKRIPNLAGYWERDDNGDRIYWMFPHVFKDDVCKGLNRNQVCRALKGNGMLITTNSGGKNSTQKDIKGHPKRRFYKLQQSG